MTDIVTSTVETKTWVDNGGAGAILGESLGTAKVLVVMHRYEVQKKIVAMLDEIRTIAANKRGGDELPRRKRPMTRHGGGGMAGGMGGGMGGLGVIPPAGKSGSGNSPSPNPPAKK